MPWLVPRHRRAEYLPAVPAARLILVAAAIQLVLSWTKTFPVTIGRPGLRLWAHGVETAVMLPLIVVLGKQWGVTGAGRGGAGLVGRVCAPWVVILLRLRRTGLTRSVITAERWARRGIVQLPHREAAGRRTARGTSRCSRRSSPALPRSRSSAAAKRSITVSSNGLKR